jgi:alpha-glucosidase
MQITETDGGFDIHLDGRLVLRHRPDAPALFVGRGAERIEMHRGNFDISDYVEARIPLRVATVGGAGIALSAAEGLPPLATLTASGDDRGGTLAVEPHDPSLNRFWLRLHAEPGERVWGGGEQMSYLDLRGRRFPFWTSEPGVGRDKTTEITFKADVTGKSGGDFFWTNYPQPTALTSRRLAFHLDTTAWSAFDLRHEAFHEIEVWHTPPRLELWAEDSLAGLVTAMADRFGRQPRLPDWVMQGAIIGLKQGEESFARLERYLAAGVPVTGLWCEDWAGVRQTSFVTRLFWNWQANDARYPRLGERIAELSDRGIRFLAYVSPYLCNDGALFPEAEAGGHFGRTASGETYLVDFGEFFCGVLDFTRAETREWFADRVIGREMLDIGVRGFMCDFGEYLPTDIVLHDGDAKLLHNAWPVLWGSVAQQAVESRGLTGEAVYFMRAGYSGIQGVCPLLWAGDQSVDFSRHDGLVTTVVAALSSGLLGNAYTHSDIGGYTSLFGNVRTAELLMRWTEMAAFTPVMRTHEGNRPKDNLQVDKDEAVLAHFARFVCIHAALHPYLARLCDEASARGLPLQRPLFLHHEDDPAALEVWDQYLLGPDLLVAPVWQAGCASWSPYLPAGADWVHLWTGERHQGGTRPEVGAPIGAPPVFWREGSADAALFRSLAMR